MAKANRSMRNSVVFLVTFLVFLLLFGGVMAWGITEFWKQTKEPTPAPEEAPTPVVRPDYRLLLVTEEAGEAEGFVVLSAEPGKGRVQVVPLPRETVVTDGLTQTRLFERYRAVDMPTVAEDVEMLLGWEIDHWAVMTYENLERLVTYLGDGVIYTLTEPVSYTAAGGNTVHMKSGARTLSATQVTDLFRYDAWHGGRRGRATIQGDLLAAIIDQYFVVNRFDEADTDFHTVINWVRSDILTSDFAAAREDLLTLARHNQHNLCTTRRPAGEFVGVGADMRFEMADDPLA